MSDQYTVKRRIPVWEFPDMPYRDPLHQWAQSAADPAQPVTHATVHRALIARRLDRAFFLFGLWEDTEPGDHTFERTFKEYLEDTEGHDGLATIQLWCELVKLHLGGDES